jgi:eukaryotic-like serine/threonine-protein kinase
MSEQETDGTLKAEQTAPEVPDLDLIRPIGSGGFGEVWLATNRTTGRLRAVKVIPLHSSGNADPAAREISSITRLEANSRCRHPNLLQIHHVGKTARHLFYVMDPADDVSGEPASAKADYAPATLERKLSVGEKGDRSNLPERPDRPSVGARCCAQIGPVPFSALSPELCWDYSRQLLEGLAALHAAGMVHRDVKPSNCLFVGGQLKLADFGLLTEAHPLVSRVGTQKYMPPDGRMDRRADVYAAGLVIYEMLSGLPVDEFPRLGARSKEVSESPTLSALLRLILRACERESRDRPADARAMLLELTAPPKATSRLHRGWLAVASCAILLALAGLGTWLLCDRTGAEPGPAEEPSAVASLEETPSLPPVSKVDVSFVTYPFEANIYLDDVLLCDPSSPTEEPYRTPCTVGVLAARKCRVAFKLNGHRWNAEGNPYDLSKTQQIVSRMP